MRRLYVGIREPLIKSRLTAWHTTRLHLFRHSAQLSLNNREIACAQSVRSDEKSDGAICAPDLISASLEHYAKPSDFVFLDPPYLPISEYADFIRYTKEQFYEEDHIELAKIIMKLHERGCHVILTNSNHPLVHELYASYNIDVIQTKRHISCNGSNRKGEDVIVTIPPKQYTLMKLLPRPLPEQVSFYPPTRFMGSKSKLLSEIWSVASQFDVNREYSATHRRATKQTV